MGTIKNSLLVRKGEVYYLNFGGNLIAYNDPRFPRALHLFRKQTELDPIRLGRQKRRQYEDERLLIKCYSIRLPNGKFKLRNVRVEPILEGSQYYNLLTIVQ